MEIEGETLRNIVTSDGEIISIPEKFLKKSHLLSSLIEESDEDEEIPVPLVSKKNFDVVLKFLEHWEPEEIGNINCFENIQVLETVMKFDDVKDIPQFYKDFIKSLTLEEIVSLFNNSKYLHIPSLTGIINAFFMVEANSHDPDDLLEKYKHLIDMDKYNNDPETDEMIMKKVLETMERR